MQTETLTVTGMTCGGCTSKVTEALQAIPGVGEVKVSLSTGTATVQYDERTASPDQLKSALNGAGFGVNGSDSPALQSKHGCCG